MRSHFMLIPRKGELYEHEIPNDCKPHGHPDKIFCTLCSTGLLAPSLNTTLVKVARTCGLWNINVHKQIQLGIDYFGSFPRKDLC